MAPEITIPTAGILVVEDDPAFLTLLHIALQEAGARHIFLSSHPDEALQLFKAEKPDIIFIDIALDGRYEAGLALGRSVRLLDHSASIIFLTALYTEEMYEQCLPLRPSAFLNKEISVFKIRQALDQAIRHKQSFPAPSFVLPEQKKGGPSYVHYPVLFKTAEGYRQILPDDILFFFADKKSTIAQTASAAHTLEVSLRALGEAFQLQFARIHKSYLVNLKAIESISPKESTLNINGISLPIGYAYRSVFFKRINITR